MISLTYYAMEYQAGLIERTADLPSFTNAMLDSLETPHASRVHASDSTGRH